MATTSSSKSAVRVVHRHRGQALHRRAGRHHDDPHARLRAGSRPASRPPRTPALGSSDHLAAGAGRDRGQTSSTRTSPSARAGDDPDALGLEQVAPGPHRARDRRCRATAGAAFGVTGRAVGVRWRAPTTAIRYGRPALDAGLDRGAERRRRARARSRCRRRCRPRRPSRPARPARPQRGHGVGVGAASSRYCTSNGRTGLPASRDRPIERRAAGERRTVAASAAGVARPTDRGQRLEHEHQPCARRRRPRRPGPARAVGRVVRAQRRLGGATAARRPGSPSVPPSARPRRPPRRHGSIVPSTGSATAAYASSTPELSPARSGRGVAAGGAGRQPSASPRSSWDRITPELPRAPSTAPRASAAARRPGCRRPASAPPAPSAAAARRSGARLVPVSASATGKTLRASMPRPGVGDAARARGGGSSARHGHSASSGCRHARPRVLADAAASPVRRPRRAPHGADRPARLAPTRWPRLDCAVARLVPSASLFYRCPPSVRRASPPT